MGYVKVVCVPRRSSLRKKVGDNVGRMNFATFGAYSIGFHINFDFAGMDFFFQIFSIIIQK